MTEKLIQAQARAARIACRRMTALHLKALPDSVEQACRVPAGFGRDPGLGDRYGRWR